MPDDDRRYLVVQGTFDKIENVLERHDFRAGRFSVGYRSCDDSNTQTGVFDRGICASNATAYADAPKLVAVMITLALFAPWIGAQLTKFTASLMELLPRLSG